MSKKKRTTYKAPDVLKEAKYFNSDELNNTRIIKFEDDINDVQLEPETIITESVIVKLFRN